MWRFIGVLSLLLLPCAIDAGNKDMKPCPDNQVCVLFVKDTCDGKYADPLGVLWTPNYLEKCNHADHNGMTARIDFEIHDAYNWTMLVTTWQYIYKVSFEFAGSKLKFGGTSDVPTGQFVWGSNSIDLSITTHPPWPADTTFGDRYPYSFKLNANGEHLINLIGGVITYKDGGVAQGTKFTDDQFLSLIGAKIGCYVTELKEADPCIGECISMKDIYVTGLSSAARICQKKLWYHNKDEDTESKNWAEAEGIKCVDGRWEMEMGQSNGTASGRIGDSLEFQCSEFTPTHPFPMGAKIGLAIGGGIGLLVIMGVIGFFIWRHFERKDAKTASAMGIVTGFRPQDLPKGYLDKPKSMRNDLPIGSARTPGDEGTQKEKDAGTPASPADTPTPDSKV